MRHVLVAAALFLAPTLRAQEPAPRPLSLTGDVGFVNTAGNTDVTTLNVGEKLTYTTGRLTGRQTFSVVYGRTDSVTSASQWRGGLRGDYSLTPAVAVYATLDAERNRFAGIARLFQEGAGLALSPLRSPHDTLTAEAGVTLSQQRTTLATTDNFTSLRGAATYRHRFGAAAYFSQAVEVLPNLDVGEDLRINAETALVAPLSRRLAIKVSYVVRFDNLPEPGFAKTDRLLTSGLQVTL